MLPKRGEEGRVVEKVRNTRNDNNLAKVGLRREDAPVDGRGVGDAADGGDEGMGKGKEKGNSYVVVCFGGDK